MNQSGSKSKSMSSADDISQAIIRRARAIYSEEFIPLHRPVFDAAEVSMVTETIESNFVSSVGRHVADFENSVKAFTGHEYAIATVNGTSALHLILSVIGCDSTSEVICPALTFVATANAVSYTGAAPSFVDSDLDTLGMSPDALRNYLEHAARVESGVCFNKATGKRILACLPMHTFGLPCRTPELASICEDWNLILIEDCAEALGSFHSSSHLGAEGLASAFSFNGNKIITTGGGGMVVTNDAQVADSLRHRATTAKVPHAYLFDHDEVAYNYRMPSLNAAMGVAQMKKLPKFLQQKRQIAGLWRDVAIEAQVEFVDELPGSSTNYWLNAFLLPSREVRDQVLETTNASGVMTRPVWTLMHRLNMYRKCSRGPLPNSEFLADRILNVPSSVPNNPS